MFLRPLVLASVATLASSLSFSSLAQSTVGELLDKGGKQWQKADYEGMFPARLQYRWPNGQGEGDLVFTADGQLSGSEYHYASRSESPATGTWKVEDDGKFCAPKEMKAWRSRTNLCWYSFRLGDEQFMSLTTERDAKLLKIKALSKVQ